VARHPAAFMSASGVTAFNYLGDHNKMTRLESPALRNGTSQWQHKQVRHGAGEGRIAWNRARKDIERHVWTSGHG